MLLKLHHHFRHPSAIDPANPHDIFRRQDTDLSSLRHHIGDGCWPGHVEPVVGRLQRRRTTNEPWATLSPIVPWLDRSCSDTHTDCCKSIVLFPERVIFVDFESVYKLVSCCKSCHQTQPNDVGPHRIPKLEALLRRWSSPQLFNKHPLKAIYLKHEKKEAELLDWERLFLQSCHKFYEICHAIDGQISSHFSPAAQLLTPHRHEMPGIERNGSTLPEWTRCVQLGTWTNLAGRRLQNRWIVSNSCSHYRNGWMDVGFTLLSKHPKWNLLANTKGWFWYLHGQTK